MPEKRDIIELLDKVGAVKLFTRNQHLKYRLPNGHLFIGPSTPSDRWSWDNSMAQLRRALRETNPQEIQRPNLPKNKRFANHTIGSALRQKDSDVLKDFGLETALPLMDCLPQLKTFEVTPTEYQPPAIALYHAPRKPRELKPPPPPVRTLSPEQLTEANRILHLEGQAAMDRFIANCHDSLIPTSGTLLAERIPTPIAPSDNTMEDIMDSNLINRVNAELVAVNIRLAGYTERKAELEKLIAQEERDVMLQTRLEEFIKKQEAVAAEAVSLLQDVLPPPPPAPVLAVRPATTRNGTTRQKANRGVDFGIVEIREKVFPVLRKRQLVKFGRDEVMPIMEQVGLSGAKWGFTVGNWLTSYCKKHDSQITQVAPGTFAFKGYEKSNAA